MTEFSKADGNFINSSSIELEIPSASWEIDDLELNFTNMEFGIQYLSVEDTPTGNLSIDKFHEGYGVQIAIQDTTTVYAVSIYGNNESTENKPIYLQINGYDNITNSPSSEIYGSSILLNMSYSLVPSWHNQAFPEPILLEGGNYFLTINGSSIGNSPKSDYFWFYNDENPQYPGLHISEYDSGTWTAGIQGTPFLYQINQKIYSDFFPEEINMTAELNGNSYEVANVGHPGKGYLKKTNLNYNPNKKDVKIKIKNNRSQKLEFNLSYSMTTTNKILAPTSLKIKKNASNEWTITPTISSVSSNHYVNFSYPQSWNNIVVLKNLGDVTIDIIIDSFNNTLSIPSLLIEDGAVWEIKANSPNININLNIPSTEWAGDQELYFEIGDPLLDGIYEFVLLDHEGIQIHQDNITLPNDENIFTYLVPSNILEGDYTAHVYWYNQTDAGYASYIFLLSPQIFISNPPDLLPFLIIGASIGGVAVVGGSSYIVVKKSRKKHANQRKLLMEKCSEIINIEYIIVLHKKSGIDVYADAFGEKEIDPTLISGFLQAIQNFGSEVLGRAKESRTFKIEYQKSILIMAEFVNLRLIVIMKEPPSKNFIYTLESLAYDIYRDYGHLLENFQGTLGEFQGIRDLLEEHLNISFLYPLTINSNMKIKLSQSEREVRKKAFEFLQNTGLPYFYSKDILPEGVCTPSDFETIHQLIKKRVFIPNILE
ncbi:MAG: hypothetical protein ACXADU_15085 [Promethearchaeota archaeon]|jgi:hypothetical protein